MSFQVKLPTIVVTALFAISCGTATPDKTVIETFATASQAEQSALIEARAQFHNVSSASITVLDGDQFTNHYVGMAYKTAVFQAASLSKAVAAAGILTLMEQEDIDIDIDIRERFTSLDIMAIPGGDKPLSVRELLSHTAGASQGGYPGYRRNSALPTSLLVVTNPPSRLVRPVTLDGEKGHFDYSGGGYQLAQILVEDISGQTFAELMQTLIFEPLGMKASTFQQPIKSDEISPLHIIGANSGIRLKEGVFTPLKNSWHNYPEQAAAGLWTTSQDYAVFIQALIQASNKETGGLSSNVAGAMIQPLGKPNWVKPGESYGLGLIVEPDTTGRIVSIRHSGLNAGYRSLFEAKPQKHMIVVSLSNAPGGAAFNEEVVIGFLNSDKP